MTDPLDALARGAATILGRPLSHHERVLFGKYLILLIKWQKSQRLVGSDRPGWIVENLFLDSLLFLRVLPPSLGSILDLGSGAGIPGVPIKIVRPDLSLVLVEARRRRVSFLTTVIRELGLENSHVLGGRIEESMSELEGRFDAVVMRCAGDSKTLLPIASRLVAKPGLVVASGPPRPTEMPLGDWVNVEGRAHGMTRRFLVYRHS